MVTGVLPTVKKTDGDGMNYHGELIHATGKYE